MKPWVTLAQAGDTKLQERDGEYVIRQRGLELMSTKRHHSESAMASYARGRTLIGGLGLGFTLRAALETKAERIVVAELEPAVVEWNRGLLKLEALNDPRVTIHLGDVAGVEGKFDAILIDTDNGPNALSNPHNGKLYGPAGLARFRQMLKARGVLVVWSASQDELFVKRLGRAGFDARQEACGNHTLFVAARFKTGKPELGRCVKACSSLQDPLWNLTSRS